MALSGLRELSLITTPPPERLAVETFILPFDEVVIREAILRERARGGQVFYVCPRLEHLETLEPKLRHLVPEITIAHAHGQMKPSAIETVMNDLEAGRIDLLLSTNIVESGIDIATANTLIVHRSDLFGLAQLYQLRGRVGRGRRQGYAYLTLPAMGGSSATAQRRLEVMQSLDYLGAGFTLASHDMDIRGAGNLVGEEQSGHIKEVGIELYQHLLQQAVEDLQAERTGLARTSDWTPHIVLPAPVRIPETYVADLSLRLGLYRRVGDLKTPSDIDNFGVELVDRFGPLPGDVQNLLFVMTLKVLCKRGFVDKLEIGLKGALFSFYHQTFPYPETLIPFLAQAPLPCRLRPDHKISLLAPVHTRDGMRNLRLFLEKLGSLAHPEPQTI